MNNKDIAKRLKELRVKRGLTQEELADKLFLTRQAVSRWEKEKSLPDYSTLDLLSKEYKVSLDYILFGIEESKKTNIKQIYIDYLLSLNKKNRIKTIIISVLILFIFIFSLYNMIMYYGKVNVYEFSYRDDEISCTNAYMYLTNDYGFFQSCDIALKDPNETLEYQEYYIEAGDSIELMQGFNTPYSKINKQYFDNIHTGRLFNFRLSWGYIDRFKIFKTNWTIHVKILTDKREYSFSLNKERLYRNNGSINECQFCYQ